jgi:bifunctional polynucleotide phosphatase/kinase
VWLDLAERLNVPIRLFHFKCPIELAVHNNMYRAVYAPKEIPARTLLPASAFWSYKNDFQQPEKDEGFDEVRSVNFAWGGTDEQRRYWDMYMLVTR